jgi:SulP family sulfate permease
LKRFFKEFTPKLIVSLRSGYSFAFFRKDLLAGFTIGIISLPLAMAFAIASGASPEKGLYTAIVAGFLISAFGGSRVQIGGPTGAFVVLVYDIIQRNGYEGLAFATLLAGFLLILFGLFKFGTWIKYIPYPLIVGFTTGLALVIFSAQIKDFFGLDLGVLPKSFLGKWILYFSNASSFHTPTLMLSSGTFLLIVILRKFTPKLPWGAIAIAAATFVSYFLDLPVQTIASRFGDIPKTLPAPSFSFLQLPEGADLAELVIDAIAIALLAGIESLLSAVIGDGMIGDRHKSNCELVAQGFANCASVVFGGLPATGAIARTAANAKIGAHSPIAGITHAVVLLFIMMFFSQIASLIPLASLAAVLVMVAWNMAEVHHFIRQFEGPKADIAVLLLAFLLTVFVDVTTAICLGMVLASFLFMKRMSEFSKLLPLTQTLKEANGASPESDPQGISQREIPPDVEVYELQGPFFFGAADLFQDSLSNFEKPPQVMILRMRHVPWIDSSGIYALKDFIKNCTRHKMTLILSGVRGQTESALKKAGIHRILENKVFPDIDTSLKEAKKILEASNRE